MECCLITIAAVSLLIAGIVVLASILSRKSTSVQGRHVLITGGSSGIGKCCAIEFAKRGANLTLVARDKTKLEQAKVEIEEHIEDKSKQTVNIVSLDISQNYGNVESTIKKAEEKLGAVFVLMNCAGIAIPGRMEDTSVDNLRKMLDINFIGSYYVTKSVISSMKSKQEGHIVFTSSQAGIIGVYGYTAYSAAKFALRGLAETLQMEVKPYNIRVTLALPPDTDTPGFIEEEKTKPEETRLISETSGIHKPEAVAKALVNDVLLGKFFSTVGFDGKILSALCAGMSPVTSVVELLAQVFTMGILRLVAVLLLQRFDSIVRSCHKKREAAKQSESTKKDK